MLYQINIQNICRILTIISTDKGHDQEFHRKIQTQKRGGEGGGRRGKKKYSNSFLLYPSRDSQCTQTLMCRFPHHSLQKVAYHMTPNLAFLHVLETRAMSMTIMYQ